MDKTIFKDVLTCSICLYVFDEKAKCPRMLNCGHSFCHSCLKLLLTTRPCCPSCEVNFHFPKAEFIPVNISLKSLISLQSKVSKPLIPPKCMLPKVVLHKIDTKQLIVSNSSKLKGGNFDDKISAPLSQLRTSYKERNFEEHCDELKCKDKSIKRSFPISDSTTNSIKFKSKGQDDKWSKNIYNENRSLNQSYVSKNILCRLKSERHNYETYTDTGKRGIKRSHCSSQSFKKFKSDEQIDEKKHTTNADEMSIDVTSTVSDSKKSSTKFLSEGHCDEHDTYKGMRCMDCEAWICGMCGLLYHKQCRTLLVMEAYMELKKEFSLRVSNELREMIATDEEISKSLEDLILRRKELTEELEKCEIKINDLHSLKFQEIQFIEKFKQLQSLIEKSVSEIEFSKAKNDMDKLMKKRRKLILDLPSPPTRPTPLSIEKLSSLCEEVSVYAVAEEEDIPLYGKVTVKEGRVKVYSFQEGEPHPKSTIIPLKELVHLFSKSSVLSTFLQLTPKHGRSYVVEIVVETDGISPRAKNFFLLCTGLEGSSFKGMAVYGGYPAFYQLASGLVPVVKGIRMDDCKTSWTEGCIYGMTAKDSSFQIQLKNNPTYSSIKFGVIVEGLQDLKSLLGECSVTECGLVI